MDGAFAIPDMVTVTIARVFVNEFVSRFGARHTSIQIRVEALNHS